MSAWYGLEPRNWKAIADAAVEEDLGTGDVSGSCFPADSMVDWYIEAQADGVLCGAAIAGYLLGSEPTMVDGGRVGKGSVVIEGHATARQALAYERTALNFLMHLSGVATLTDLFVQLVRGTHARIIDTRKTFPGLRSLQKYAVRCGGGHNHRMGLYDAAMIKDNHIVAAGSITKAVEAIRRTASHMIKIEVECETLAQVEEAIQARAEIVLLDNMNPVLMTEAVNQFNGRAIFEASGGVNLSTVRVIAETGVDVISVGQLTHSAPSLSMHMELR